MVVAAMEKHLPKDLIFMAAKVMNDIYQEVQSTLVFSNARYLELSLSRTFYSVPSILQASRLKTLAISNFHYLEHFLGPLKSFLG